MRLKTWPIISDAVERGLAYGYRRARKHAENPGEAALLEALHLGIMGEIAEIIDFDAAEEIPLRGDDK